MEKSGWKTEEEEASVLVELEEERSREGVIRTPLLESHSHKPVAGKRDALTDDDSRGA